MPLYINRSSGDKQWAYRAAEQPTIALALKQLETQLDGEKSRLTQSIEFFCISPSDSDMTNRSAISSFWFKVQDAGKDLGVTNDLIVYKFLQHVPNGNKVYEKLKETINPSMTEQDMTAVFDKAQNEASNFHVRDPEESNCKVEESDEDDQVYFGGNRSQTKQGMFCKICRKSNHTAKNCYHRRCFNCQGNGHDTAKCPPFRKKPSLLPKKKPK